MKNSMLPLTSVLCVRTEHTSILKHSSVRSVMEGIIQRLRSVMNVFIIWLIWMQRILFLKIKQKRNSNKRLRRNWRGDRYVLYKPHSKLSTRLNVKHALMTNHISSMKPNSVWIAQKEQYMMQKPSTADRLSI